MIYGLKNLRCAIFNRNVNLIKKKRNLKNENKLWLKSTWWRVREHSKFLLVNCHHISLRRLWWHSAQYILRKRHYVDMWHGGKYSICILLCVMMISLAPRVCPLAISHNHVYRDIYLGIYICICIVYIYYSFCKVNVCVESKNVSNT